MERALRQLETYISGIRPEDRDAVVDAMRTVFQRLKPYPSTFTGLAVVEFLGGALLAYNGRKMDRFWKKAATTAKEIGPNVSALFSAL